MNDAKSKPLAAADSAGKSLPQDKTSLQKYFKYYASWLVLIWPALALYSYLPYYHNYLTASTMDALRDLAIIYTLGAPAAYYQAAKKRALEPSRAYLALCTLGRLASGYKTYLAKLVSKAFYPAPAISAQERTNLLFMIVKLFFLPLMLNFLFDNLSGIRHGIDNLNAQGASLSLSNFNAILYPLIFSILLLIDTAYFSFGYAIETKLLNNRVVSVDPTFLGWASALICYPPFNGIANNYISWHANDYAVFHSAFFTSGLYLMVLALMTIYVAATVALGAKASNLTNRGIVRRWPYSLIRHPAYISKNLAWWITLAPALSVAAVLSMAAWSFIYFLRAITEERHLMMVDNGYREYARQVRWRFIPGLI